jgi:hypothetical protein
MNFKGTFAGGLGMVSPKATQPAENEARRGAGRGDAGAD